MIVECTVVKDIRHIAVEQHIYRPVTFAVEWRQQIDESAQYHRTDGKLNPRIFEFAKHLLHQAHCAGEIKRHKSTEQTQHYHIRNARSIERLALREEKFEIITRVDIRHGGTCYGCHHQRHHRRCREVEHQHFYCEQHSGYWCLEDAGNTRCSTTAHKHHKRSGRKAQHTAQIRTDGCSGVYYRAFGSNRTAKTYGYGTRHHRGIHIMYLKSTLFLRYGI